MFAYVEALDEMMREDQYCFQYATPFSSLRQKREVLLFHTNLVARGGVYADIPIHDHKSLWILMLMGKVFEGENVSLISEGTENEIAEILESISDDPDSFSAYAGYALFKDGIWRPHGWVYNSLEDIVVDSIPAKRIYFGVAIRDDALEETKAMIINHEEDSDGEAIPGWQSFQDENMQETLRLLKIRWLRVQDDTQMK